MYETVARLAEQSTVRACWRQWRALKGEGLLVGERPVQAIIDPEALVLASLSMRHRERRFEDLLLWWASEGARLLSVQRLQTMMGAFPRSLLDGGVEWFAALALQAGDGRWRRLASGTTAAPTRTGKGPRELNLLEPSTVMLRLRAGFGVGAKADLVAFLMGVGSRLREKEVWATVRVISEAISYSRASVSRAATDVSLARFIDASEDRPPMYSLDPESWARAIRLWDPYRRPETVVEGAETTPIHIPPWRFWSHVYAFLVASVGWTHDASTEKAAPVVHASRARDITERCGRHLAWNGIELPDARMHTGERYLVPFADLVKRVAMRVEADL